MLCCFVMIELSFMTNNNKHFEKGKQHEPTNTKRLAQILFRNIAISHHGYTALVNARLWLLPPWRKAEQRGHSILHRRSALQRQRSPAHGLRVPRVASGCTPRSLHQLPAGSNNQTIRNRAKHVTWTKSYVHSHERLTGRQTTRRN